MRIGRLLLGATRKLAPTRTRQSSSTVSFYTERTMRFGAARRMITQPTTLQSKWKDMTDRLWKQPVGSMDPGKWNEAITILTHWFGKYTSNKNFEVCWKILDRLCTELENKNLMRTTQPILSTMDILNPILVLWRDNFYHHHEESLLPSVVSKELSRFESQNLIRMDAASHAILLDVASKYSALAKSNKEGRGPPSEAFHEEGVYFANEYFKNWMERYHKDRQSVRPDVVALGTVVHAWVESGLPDAPERAEEWIRDWEEFQDRHPPRDTASSKKKLYTFVLLAWARAGNPVKAQEWIDRMIAEEEYPDVQAYNCLLMAHQAAADPKAAEEILKHMQKLHHEKRHGGIEPPNVVSYNIVIDAWTKKTHSKNPDAAKRAHNWMEQMKASGIAPNTVTFNTVITAYSRAGQPFRSERLLHEMIAAQSPTNASQPDVQSFTSVVAGWARVGTLEAAKRAEGLLTTMQQVSIPPNVETYGSCIHAWARVGSPQAVARAEKLYAQLTSTLSPDVYAYTGMIQAYGRNGNPQRAHEFLKARLAEYDRTQDPRMKPTVVTFTAILHAWSKAKRIPDAAQKAHEILYQMNDVYGIQPNAFSYSAVLNAYSVSTNPNAAQKALELFEEMRNVALLEPNAYTCSNVLKAMAKGGKVQEAEALLHQLVHERVPLSAHAVSAVLHGWSKSRAPEQAEALLQQMHLWHEEGRIQDPPNAICYNNLLAAWAQHPQKAEDWLQTIITRELVEVNTVMYNTVMNAWANKGNAQKTREWYERFLDHRKRDSNLGPPDAWTYRALWKSVIKTKQMTTTAEKLRELEALVESMQQSGLCVEPTMKADLKDLLQQEDLS